MQNIAIGMIAGVVGLIIGLSLIWAGVVTPRKKSPHAPDLFTQPGRIIASYDYDKEILSTLDKIHASMEKSEDAAKKHRAGVEIVLEEIVGYLKKQTTSQERTSLAIQKLVALYDGGTTGYTDMTDEEASVRERSARYERTYGISHDEAMRRARNDLTYQSNSGGMGGSV